MRGIVACILRCFMFLCIFAEIEKKQWNIHCTKSVRIWSFSGPYFPAFELNTDQKNSNMDTFHAVIVTHGLTDPEILLFYKEYFTAIKISTWMNAL